MNPIETRLMSRRQTGSTQPIDTTVVIILKLIDSLSTKSLESLIDELPDQMADRILVNAEKGQEFYDGCIGTPATIEDAPTMLADAETDALWDQKITEAEKAVYADWLDEGRDL